MNEGMKNEQMTDEGNLTRHEIVGPYSFCFKDYVDFIQFLLVFNMAEIGY